jgi:hypothetical protein
MSRKPVARKTGQRRSKRDWYDYAMLVLAVATFVYMVWHG